MSVSQVWGFFVEYADKSEKGTSCTVLFLALGTRYLMSKCCTWVNIKHQNPFDLALSLHKGERHAMFL